MSIICIRDLTKLYDGSILALDRVSMSINKGDFFALLGKNGAGKSTAIGILTSLVKKDSGKVYISDYDLDFDIMNIKSLIGFVPQEYNFSQFETVHDIVLNQAGFYGIKRSLAIERAKFYLNFFGLWEKRYSVSMSLSGGMKRRLMIVRALIHDPNILILDEPTAGVDILSRRLIWDFLRDFNKEGKTIILTTHYLEEVEYLCNSVAIIDLGSILLRTSVYDLLNRVSKRTILLEVENSDNIDRLDFINFKLFKKDRNLIEVLFVNDDSLNFLFDYLIKRGVIINNVKNKHNRLEELFVDLVT